MSRERWSWLCPCLDALCALCPAAAAAGRGWEAQLGLLGWSSRVPLKSKRQRNGDTWARVALMEDRGSWGSLGVIPPKCQGPEIQTLSSLLADERVTRCQWLLVTGPTGSSPSQPELPPITDATAALLKAPLRHFGKERSVCGNLRNVPGTGRQRLRKTLISNTTPSGAPSNKPFTKLNFLPRVLQGQPQQ